MNRLIALAFATAVLVPAPALLAQAQQASVQQDPASLQPEASNSSVSMCGKRVDIVSALAKEFKENPMAIGMVDQSAVLEVFVSDGGTWTILASRTDGSSCIVSSGDGWQSQSLVIGKDA